MGSIRISIVYRVHSYRALKYAGKPWIHQTLFHQCFKSTISPSFLLSKFFTIRYIVYIVCYIQVHINYIKDCNVERHLGYH